MFSLLLICDAAAEDRLVAELYEAGTAGIAEEPGGVRAFFENESEKASLLDRFAAFQPSIREEPATDWEEATRQSFPALSIGLRWFLVPPWSADPTPRERLRLEVNPGMACGTGWHACTQLCLEALEDAVRPGDTVVDVGAGSGILSQAAEALGAARVYGCDIDYDTVRIARGSVRAALFAGSADAVRAGIADVVVANISSAAADDLAEEFRRISKPGGTAIVSGFSCDDLPAKYRGCGLLQRDGWACLVCRHFVA